MDIAAIGRRISLIRKLEEENKVRKDTLKQALESDVAYVEANKAVKEVSTKRKLAKDAILNQPANRAILEDIQVDTEEIATLKEILSAELVDVFAKNGGKAEIPDESGELVKFKFLVKLLPKGFTDQP